MLWIQSRVQFMQARNLQGLAMFLKEQLAPDAARGSQKRNGSPGQVRENASGRLVLVAHQIHLGQSCTRIDDAFWMGDKYTANFRRSQELAGRSCRSVFARRRRTFWGR